MAMPKLIATIEIRIIGFEKEFLLPLMILRAKNSSKFKLGVIFCIKQK
tara:strand:- start:25497 stop:25640 length:144 start_codon:yes stop_codon:yes gene_type:complete